MNDSNQSEHSYRPLADRMRPRSVAEFVGQPHIMAPGKPLRRAIEEGHLHSMVFWGPPGTGKTTLARLIAGTCGARFAAIPAVLSGVKDIREAISKARHARDNEERATVLFVDEVHRFNKSQQDAFLPHVEDGTIYFIGATTENPSFELNNALLSRVRTYVLKPLEVEEIRTLLDQALENQERGLGRRRLEIAPDLKDTLAQAADGDARRALNLLEVAADLADEVAGSVVITAEVVEEVTREGLRRFDKGGDIFYDQVSALHKSVRGTDPDAALYWLCRVLDGGCDPLYVARRLVRIACEDVGNADPRALQLTLNAWDAYERLGHPEGELAIAQAVVYLACAPKSNAVYSAHKAAMHAARSSGSLDVPLHLRNAPTEFTKKLGYGTGYRYAHDEPEAFAAGENYLPPELATQNFYFPVERGMEIKIGEKLARLKLRNRELNNS